MAQTIITNDKGIYESHEYDLILNNFNKVLLSTPQNELAGFSVEHFDKTIQVDMESQTITIGDEEFNEATPLTNLRPISFTRKQVEFQQNKLGEGEIVAYGAGFQGNTETDRNIKLVVLIKSNGDIQIE